MKNEFYLFAFATSNITMNKKQEISVTHLLKHNSLIAQQKKRKEKGINYVYEPIYSTPCQESFENYIEAMKKNHIKQQALLKKISRS